MNIVLAYFAVLCIIFLVPFVVYGVFATVGGLEESKKSLNFFYGVLVQKKGTALGFVVLLYLGREIFIENWLLYAAIWVVMFALTEIGQVFMSEYSTKEALGGILSEAIYFPLAAWVAASLL